MMWYNKKRDEVKVISYDFKACLQTQVMQS